MCTFLCVPSSKCVISFRTYSQYSTHREMVDTLFLNNKMYNRPYCCCKTTCCAFSYTVTIQVIYCSFYIIKDKKSKCLKSVYLFIFLNNYTFHPFNMFTAKYEFFYLFIFFSTTESQSILCFRYGP